MVGGWCGERGDGGVVWCGVVWCGVVRHGVAEEKGWNG